MHCFITRTGSMLPGPNVPNEQIQRYLGVIEGEQEVQHKVLSMNGIVGRHYAQDENQVATDDVYGLATQAVAAALNDFRPTSPITYLAAGTTYAPFAGPGIATILHDRLKTVGILDRPLEISSHAGICTSAAQAMIAAIRGVACGDHQSAMCVGAEHASQVLKSSVMQPIDDRSEHTDLRKTQWFMSVFLRSMLSDGAGAFVLENQPQDKGLSLQVDWTHSMSMASEAPLCMKLDNENGLLSQDVTILSRHLVPTSSKFLAEALKQHNESLDTYSMILPHMSSFFFRRKMERVLQEHFSDPNHPVPYWTNLATAGNTGAASIYVMLDAYLREHELHDGDRIMLFVPESGQFNYVMVSLTAVVR